MNHRKLLTSTALAGVGASLLILGGAHSAVAAATTVAPADNQISEVIVTARKKSENLQKVPLAITALSSETLASAGVQNLSDIANLTPGLVLNGQTSGAFSTPVIRGQVDLNTASVDSNVPVFFDGVYISNSSAIDFASIDLERVEVIKGPVSSTYGRSAYAGAINYVSAKPHNTFGGSASVTVGDYNKTNVKLSLSGAIIPDVLKIGVTGAYDHFNGTWHDSVTNLNAGGDQKRDFLITADYTPNAHLEISPTLYYGDDFFGISPTMYGAANCGATPAGTAGNYSQTYCGKLSTSSPGFQGPYVAAPGSTGQTGNNRKVYTTNIPIKLTYDWGTVTLLTGYNNVKDTTYSEFDNSRYGVPVATYYLPPGAMPYTTPTPAALVYAGTPTGNLVNVPLHFGYVEREADFSQEIRYASRQDRRIRYSVGGYYDYSQDFTDLRLAQSTVNVPAGQYIIQPFAVPPGTPFSGQQTENTQRDKIFAGFGSLEVDLTNKLTVSTELRYTSTRVAYDQDYAVYNPYGVGYSIGLPSAALHGPTFLKTFKDITSRTSLNYKLTPDTLLYVSAANGSKIGGFNNNGTAYNPEKNWTYELGVKTTLLERTLQINADVFYVRATDFQIYAPASTSVVGNYVTSNYGGLNTPGLEVALVYVPVSGVKLTSGLAIIDPKFGSSAYDFGDVALCRGIASCAPKVTTVGANTAISISGKRPPEESNFTFNQAVEWTHPLTERWNGFARLDYRYESKQFYRLPLDLGYYGPKNLVNVSAGVEDGSFRLKAYVLNLTNDKTPTTATDSVATGATNYQGGYYPVISLPNKRTIGATLSYKF